jgi:hypothetical protein
MANYFIEGAQPKDHDSKERSLQKINSLLYNAVDGSGKLQIGGVALDALELNTDQVEGKLDTTNAILTTTAADLAIVKGNSAKVPGFSLPAYDYISCSYTGSNLTGVVYKSGGSSGTTVATLTLAYDGSSNLTSVTKS